MTGATLDPLIEVALKNPVGIFTVILLLAVWIAAKYFTKNNKIKAAVELFCVVSAILLMSHLSFSAGSNETEFIIQKNGGYVKLTNNVYLKLIDIRSLRGVSEGPEVVKNGEIYRIVGDHEANKKVADNTIEKIFSKIRTVKSENNIKSLEQHEWQDFLISLTPPERNAIANNSWAIIEIRDHGTVRYSKDIFKGEYFQIDDNNKEKGTVYLKHLFNVPDLTGDDEETIIVTYSK